MESFMYSPTNTCNDLAKDIAHRWIGETSDPPSTQLSRSACGAHHCHHDGWDTDLSDLSPHNSQFCDGCQLHNTIWNNRTVIVRPSRDPLSRLIAAITSTLSFTFVFHRTQTHLIYFRRDLAHRIRIYALFCSHPIHPYQVSCLNSTKKQPRWLSKQLNTGG
eukprot:scaffold55159_cov58-Cyclotella_meneghiniana.AAC.5